MKIKSASAFFLLISALAFFTSCEDVVQIKLDEGSKLYVIDAFVNDMAGKQIIRITTNDSYFSNSLAPAVPNADVILKDLTRNKQFKFDYISNGNYVMNVSPSDSLGLVDHQYELRVTIDGDVYTSLSILKRKASIDSISSQYFDGNSGFGPPGPPYYLCYLNAKDKTDANPDYYWIKTFRNDSLIFSSSDINVAIDGSNGAFNIEGVDSTLFTPPMTFLGFNQFSKGSTCTVEIHSISHDTYFFFIQAAAQINNGGLFATTPENVKTNIISPSNAKTRAVGWFNMAGVARKTTTVD
ncbi:MAG: DUF4249 family protein [bacterium]|nr:DUF4249 family protein [bacterium]